MNTSTTVTGILGRGAAVSVIAAGALALTPSFVPQATAAPAQAQQTYSCVITVDENPGQPSTMDLTANISLNLPDQVSAGDELSVDGTFSVQLPGELGSLFGAYFPSAQVTSDSLMLPVSVGGQEQLVAMSYIDSGKIDTRNPPVVFGGSFTTDPVAVPGDAQGDVTFSMPQNDSVPAISTDGMSAFTAVMVAEGGIVPGYDKGTDRVSCSSASGESKVIGSVPVVPAAAGGSGDVGAAAPVGGAVAGGASAPSAAGSNRVQAAQAAGATGGDEESSPANEEEAAATDEGAAATRELADQLRLQSMNQAASRDDGMYVPVGVVLWGTLGIVVATVLFTVATNARTRRIERAAEEF